MKTLRILLFVWLLSLPAVAAPANGLYPMAHWFTNVAQAVNAAAARSALGVTEGGGSSGTNGVSVAVSGGLLTAITNAGVVTLSGVPQTNNFTSLVFSNAANVVWLHMMPGLTNGFVLQADINSSSNSLFALVTARLTDGTNAAVAYALNATNGVFADLLAMLNAGTNASVGYALNATNGLFADLIARLNAGTNAAVGYAINATNGVLADLLARLNAGTNAAVGLVNVASNALQTQISGLSGGGLATTNYFAAADQSTTSATAVNLNHLSFDIGANEKWSAELWGVCNASAVAGVKFAVNVPSGATVGGGVRGSGTLRASITSTALTAAMNTAGGEQPFVIHVIVQNGGTPGPVQFQFASGDGIVTATVRGGRTYFSARQIP